MAAMIRAVALVADRVGPAALLVVGLVLAPAVAPEVDLMVVGQVRPAVALAQVRAVALVAAQVAVQAEALVAAPVAVVVAVVLAVGLVAAPAVAREVVPELEAVADQVVPVVGPAILRWQRRVPHQSEVSLLLPRLIQVTRRLATLQAKLRLLINRHRPHPQAETRLL
ncbi:MAG TPA: hypothetical protein VHV54_14500 [Candidatus Binatia bacterium]|nr:hypothetical protein [Candidatus Binatia bacterium]